MSSIGWRGSQLCGHEKLHGSSARSRSFGKVVIRPSRPEAKKKQEFWWRASETRRESARVRDVRQQGEAVRLERFN
jgi:hypothetical protein